MRQLLMGVAILFVAVSGLPAQSDKPTIKVDFIEVNKALPPEIKKEGGFRWGDAETEVGLLLAAPKDKALLAVVSGKCELISFTDDKKTNLKGTPSPDSQPWLTAGGRRVTIRGYATPAPGATKLLLKAKLAVRLGSVEKTTDAAEVALKEGKTTKVGTFTVGLGDGPYVEIWSSDNNVKSAVFLDSDDKEIKVISSGSGRENPGEKGYKRWFSFKKEPDKVKVKITYYDKVETVEVPVEEEIGLGF